MTPTLPIVYETRIPADWIDYNGHMNLAHYLQAFDLASEVLLGELGLGEGYVRTEGRSLFVAEVHLIYLRELSEGERMGVTIQALAADAKRVHLFHGLYAGDDLELAATGEFMLLHVDMATRRTAPFAPEVAARIGALVARHAALPRPKQSGRRVSMGARGEEK